MFPGFKETSLGCQGFEGSENLRLVLGLGSFYSGAAKPKGFIWLVGSERQAPFKDKDCAEFTQRFQKDY